MKPWIPANLRAPEPLVLDKADAYRLKRNARRRVARAVKRDAERQISPLKSKNPQQLATDADSLTN